MALTSASRIVDQPGLVGRSSIMNPIARPACAGADNPRAVEVCHEYLAPVPTLDVARDFRCEVSRHDRP